MCNSYKIKNSRCMNFRYSFPRKRIDSVLYFFLVYANFKETKKMFLPSTLLKSSSFVIFCIIPPEIIFMWFVNYCRRKSGVMRGIHCQANKLSHNKNVKHFVLFLFCTLRNISYWTHLQICSHWKVISCIWGQWSTTNKRKWVQVLSYFVRIE